MSRMQPDTSPNSSPTNNTPGKRDTSGAGLDGLLFVIAAPSGAGKTSLVDALLGAMPELQLSISHTTRPIREGEVHGVNYHFTDRDDFESMIRDGHFLEHAEVFGNLYGTARQTLAEQRGNGRDVILEIDWQGAAQVRKEFPDAISVFILPPSRKELLARLEGRGQDSAEVIAQRTKKAHSELSQYADFDYLIVNDDFATATDDLIAVVRSSRCQRRVVENRSSALIADLLSA